MTQLNEIAKDLPQLLKITGGGWENNLLDKLFKKSIRLANSHKYNTMLAQAIEFLVKKGYNVIGKASTEHDYDFIMVRANDDNTFTPLSK